VRKRIACVGVVCSVGGALFARRLLEVIYQFVALHLSPDHHLLLKTKISIASLYFAGIVLVALASAFALGWLPRRWLAQFEASFARSTWIWVYSLSAGAVLFGLDLARRALDPAAEQFFFRLLYREYGVLENATLVGLIASAFLMLRVARRIHAEGMTFWGLRLNWWFLLLAGGLFVLGMEEISWGQRIFGWETPEDLFENNVQNETNLHNFFNPIRPYLYGAGAALLAGLVAVSGYWKTLVRRDSASRLLLPHPAMLGLALMILAASGLEIFTGQRSGELIEHLGTVFAVLYSLRLAALTRSHLDFSERL